MSKYKFEKGAPVAFERLVRSLFFTGQARYIWYPATIIATDGEDVDEESCKVKFVDAGKNDPGFIASKSHLRLLRVGNTTDNPTDHVRKCYWMVDGGEEGVFSAGAPKKLYLGDAVMVLFQNGKPPSAHHPNAAENAKYRGRVIEVGTNAQGTPVATVAYDDGDVEKEIPYREPGVLALLERNTTNPTWFHNVPVQIKPKDPPEEFQKTGQPLLPDASVVSTRFSETKKRVMLLFRYEGFPGASGATFEEVHPYEKVFAQAVKDGRVRHKKTNIPPIAYKFQRGADDSTAPTNPAVIFF